MDSGIEIPVGSSGHIFDRALAQNNCQTLRAESIDILQVNVGLRCNLECHHCHVVSSPKRTEEMTWEIMQQVLKVADDIRPRMIDITGGAPEMNTHFRRFITTLRRHSHQVQARTNLTVFDIEGYRDLPEFYLENQVELVASLPCYLEDNVDKQRGNGVFQESIASLGRLNELGYGKTDGLPLHLVYNPVGAYLPPAQATLEEDYRAHLKKHFGIEFTSLFTITNMPIGRWRSDLKRDGQFDEYLNMLQTAFNSTTIEGLMCRHQIEVGWDGTLYDCDFHLAHRLPVAGAPANIRDFNKKQLEKRKIMTRDYCFGCTAGAGSSCGGALVD